MKKTYLECGKIINTHGFRGAVKLESWCDSPSVLANLNRVWILDGGEYRSLRIVHASVFKQFVIAQLEGIDTEEAANQLRGTVLYADRADFSLDEGDFFIADLIGLSVKHADTEQELGKVIRVDTRGATDLYVIQTEAGEQLVPAVPEFVVRVDTDDAVYIRPIPGLLDGGAENV